MKETVAEPVASLVNILCCPKTKLPLKEIHIDDFLTKLAPLGNTPLVQTTLGRMWQYKPFESGFLSEDGQYMYPVQDGILFLHEEFAIPMNNLQSLLVAEMHGSSLKSSVQQFYNNIGWKKDGQNRFVDASKFEDLREVSKEYIHNCHTRLMRYLQPRGKYLVDVASGPVQYPEYLNYSKDYDYRICIDLSVVALQEARNKLGDKGIYVIADITNLPFKDNSVDAAISLHTIYHVPADEQSKAFSELNRILKTGATAVVVYAWNHDKLIRMIKNLIRPPKLYYRAHSYSWYRKHVYAHMNTCMYSWRSLNVPMMKLFIHPFLFGKTVLRFIYNLEEKFPEFMGRLGHYPLIVIQK